MFRLQWFGVWDKLKRLIVIMPNVVAYDATTDGQSR